MGVRTAAIVVNWNNHADTAECVESLKRSVTPCRIIVVDNGSRQDDAEALERIGGVTLIKSRENLGFGRGNNLGIRKALEDASIDYVFLLNNDATVMPDALGLLEGVLDERMETGIATPRILRYENPGLLWYGGGYMNWAKGMAVVPGAGGPADAPVAMTARDVGFASGCAMLIRRSVLEKVGGFDPRLFMYEEDADLCLRAANNGWTIRYLPLAVVLHKGQGSQRKDGEAFLPIQHPKNPRLPFYTYHLVRNKIIVMRTHAKGLDALKFYLAAPLYWLAKCARFALYGRFDAVAAFFSGAGDGLREARMRFVDELKDGAVRRSPPVFIVGTQRSGTTLLRLILNAHGSLAVPGEAAFLMPFLKKRNLKTPLRGLVLKAAVRYIRLNSEFGYWNYEPGRFFKEMEGVESIMADELIDRLFMSYAESEGKVCWGEKTPSFFRKIDILAAMFPNARFIHIVRDGRDVFDSWRRLDPTKGNPAVTALDWSYKLVRIERSFAGLPQQRRLTVRYEDLIDAPDAEVRRIAGFAGLEFDPAMLEFYRKSEDYIGEKHSKLIFKPLDGVNRFKWLKTLSRADAAVFTIVARKRLKAYGYKTDVAGVGVADYLRAGFLLLTGLPARLLAVMTANRRLERAAKGGLEVTGVGEAVKSTTRRGNAASTRED